MSCVDKGFSPYISLLISGLTVVLDQVIKWQTQQSIAYGDSI
ncbi:MAG TPA: signal peptidase II, partial [Alteromonas sp.]|nr:signal peptidase II [Alteromonas sp.]